MARTVAFVVRRPVGLVPGALAFASGAFAFGAFAFGAFAFGALAFGALVACGGGAGAGAGGEFTVTFPDDAAGNGILPTPVLPPPTFPRTPVWDPDAASLERVALYGSFPSDLVAFDGTLFVNDADAIEAQGAQVRAYALGGAAPVPSGAHATTTIRVEDLVDSTGAACSLATPIGFGFFLGDLELATHDAGFVLANAGGVDSVPSCANVLVVDPTLGTLRQTVNLANRIVLGPAAVDSTGAAIPGGAFVQGGAEGLCFVPTTEGRGLLLVAMSNFVIGAPSYGTVKYPGTVQIFDVDLSAAAPVSTRPALGLVTDTFVAAGFNTVAVTRFPTASGLPRVLVTSAGTTAYDASLRLLPVTPAVVEAVDVETRSRVGTFRLGLVGLSGARPALGRDAEGHRIAAFASSVLGEVYLIRTDGLRPDVPVAADVAVLRGERNGIAIDRAAAGAPGGNVSGLAFSPDGRTLVASGFGDLFAFPAPTPGRLYAIRLPADVVGFPGFSNAYVAGTAQVVTAPGATLGAVVVAPGAFGTPEVFAAVGGALDPATFLGDGPAAVGTLTTFGAIR